jgi:mannosyl-3-phosphoglycerate phosphatase
MSLPIIDPSKVIVYSDLDGTLLDHHNYSFADASPSLNKLHAANIPLVLNTSKTYAEVKVIHQDLGLNTPFIVENGAAIFMPKAAFTRKPKDSVWQDSYWVKTFASKRSHWLGLINKLSVEFGNDFEAFSDMSLRRIMEVTGLSEKNAELASQRMYGEPLLWTGSAEAQQQFIEKAKKLGASPLLGGRFLHICGDTNKGKALTWLNKEYERQWQVGALKSISLGDGNNDIAMLEAADIAVRILSPVNPPPTLTRTEGVITSTLQGPQGWHECIEHLLPELNSI